MRPALHLIWLLALVAAVGRAGDGPTGPPPAGTAIAGHWQRDAAASDDYNARIAKLLEERRRHARRNGPEGGFDRGGRDVVPPLEEVPPETDERVRGRLDDSLRPPQDLRFALYGDRIEFTGDSDPVRSLTPGEPVTRMDASGTAEVTAEWSSAGRLTIRARYTNRATRVQQYVLDRSGNLLTVTLRATDPMLGTLDLRTAYRRAAAPAPGAAAAGQ